METVVNYVVGFEWNGMLGIWLFWVPLFICVVGYAERTLRQIRKDLAERARNETIGTYYHPSVTVGVILGRTFLSVCPVVNLCCAICDVGPKMIGRFVNFLGKVFDQPIIPRRKEKTK